MPNRDYHAHRQSYEMGALSDEFLQHNPLILFQQWMDDAFEKKVDEPTAMTLSTVDQLNRPHSRIVLLKAFNEQGFVFYTHYASDKGVQVGLNPSGALTFFWPQLERQVRVEGLIDKMTSEASDSYFQSRPKDSQLGAYISQQSQTVASREELEQRMEQAKNQFKDKPVPRPDHWGGYYLKPDYIEFWQGRPNRLHDRLSFSKQPNQAWLSRRLCP
ncbi:pyridoxamine 5'-phosphate oxidase [Thiomicrospira microaerophila]|uniref:pyridoxamine 5'-phosphate oxidase n=1 Tax=Thiomicrospira microaerophila TaxID=406020 RepID=UPI00200BA66D|nr:pyridoxamine 5'-phosphate oxidase [Thiomicrospira microaerophila]UQB42764.1 pyridoxamine 5'-phosphate oxidase [Thiomicrospira microaerophila]